MSITDPTGDPTTTVEPETTDASDAEHSIKATKALTQEIRNVLDEAEVGEDVWVELHVKEPKNQESVVWFKIEGDDGLFYTVQVLPDTDTD